MHYKQFFYLLGGLFLVLFVYSCGILAPLTERSTAQTAVEKAKMVQAEKYAQEKYSTSLANFQLGEDLIVTNKKSTDNKKALVNYQVAEADANEAYNLSVDPYTSNIIQQADQQIEEAREDGLEENGGEYFAYALQTRDDMQSLYQEKNYTDVFPKVDDLNENLELARSNANQMLADIEALKEQVENLDQTAINNKALNAVPEEYQEASAVKEGAFEAIIEKRYKEAFTSLTDTVAKMEILLSLIEEKRRLAREELVNAEQVLDRIEERVKDQSQE